MKSLVLKRALSYPVVMNNWRKSISVHMQGACIGCIPCNGKGCRGKVPGMGGKGTSAVFISNCISWDDIDVSVKGAELPQLGVAPMTGVDENMGDCLPEKVFHSFIVQGAKEEGILSCIGDGTPDYKLLYGAEALRTHGVKGAVFIKPYSNTSVLDRYSQVEDTVSLAGVDIDSWNIATMTGKAALEKKNLQQLKELKREFHHPFAIKGVASEEDVRLMEELKPDIVVVSNHGGRVFEEGPGTAWILKKYISRLKNCSKEVWVDGGLRTRNHLLKASALGADRVLIGRPFIQGVAVFQNKGVSAVLKELLSE